MNLILNSKGEYPLKHLYELIISVNENSKEFIVSKIKSIESE